MPNSIHLRAAQNGAATLNAFREGNPNEVLNLNRASLQGLDLQNCNFSGADLSHANLSNCNLKNANLSGANLAGANLNGANLEFACLDKANLNNTSFVKCEMSRSSLRDLTSIVTVFEQSTMKSADLTRGEFKAATFLHADLTGAVFTDVKLSNCKFGKATIGESILPSNVFHLDTFQTSDFQGAKFHSVDMSGFDFSVAMMNHVEFNNVDLSNADFSKCSLEAAEFRNTRVMGAKFFGASLRSANLAHMDLNGLCLKNVNFSEADLREATMLGAEVDSTTRFDGVNCYRLHVDRYTAEYLHQSINNGQMMDLNIEDDLAKLRAEFSGVWSLIHALGIVVFLMPYLWFVSQRIMERESQESMDATVVDVNHWAQVAVASDELKMSDRFARAAKEGTAKTVRQWREHFGLQSRSTILLSEALIRFVCSGGVEWRDGLHPKATRIAMFCSVLLYNIFRFLLLRKTLKLETEQKVSGLPVKFSLGETYSFWRILYTIAHYGYWLSLTLIAWNTFCFLITPVPA